MQLEAEQAETSKMHALKQECLPKELFLWAVSYRRPFRKVHQIKLIPEFKLN